MTPTAFAAQKDPTLPGQVLSASGSEILEIWNRTFKVGFFEYRHLLQQIAAESLERVADADVTRGLADMHEWFDNAEEEVVFPIDDDDFFHPALTKAAEELAPEQDIVIFPQAVAGFKGGNARQRTVWLKELPLLLSNNWGVRKSFLRRHFDEQTARVILAQHPLANEKVAEHYGIVIERNRPQDLSPLLHQRVRILQTPLSVHNKHVGSAGFFNKVLRRPDAEASFRSLDLASPIVLPRYIEWAEPYLRRMEATLAPAVT
jgi:hypothetical protein